MLRYLKRRYVESVSSRIDTAVRRLETRIKAGEVKSWSEGAVHPFDLHGHAAIEALAQGVAAVYGYDVEGDIAEFGTMSGRTATGLAKSLASCDSHLEYAIKVYGHKPRKLALFDSFEGLPEVEAESVDANSPHVVDGVWSAGSLKGISAKELGVAIGSHLPADRFEIHSGWFCDTIRMLANERRFALIHIDSDLYRSAMDVLVGLFSRGMISCGAYVYFDDWNCNRADPSFGERRAWMECIKEFGIDYSDLGNYGIFGQRFVVHSYNGCVGEPPVRKQREDDSRMEDKPEVVVTGSSSDVYDHQEASKHYHQSAGMSDMDPSFVPVYERCREYSMTSSERMYALFKAVQYIQESCIEGDIVECGVWRGGSMMVVAEALKLFGGMERQLHLFDTYEGLPEPTAEDVDVWGHDAEGWWRQKRLSEKSSDWARAHLDEVQHNMRLTGFPEDKIHYIKGMVENTVPARAPDKISLLRLDTDWYNSTKHEIEQLFPRLSLNGVLIIDDYGHFKGAKRAIDEYVAARQLPLMLMRIDYTGRIAIKTHA